MATIARATLAGIAVYLSLAQAAFGQSFPVIEPEPLPEPPEEIGSWYLRGDIAYAISNEPDVIYNETAAREKFGYAELDDIATFGVGVGRRIGDWFRADLSVDVGTETELTGGTVGPCGPATCATLEQADMWMVSLLANGYADLGYYDGFSPYIGAGIGFSYLDWDYRGGLGSFSNEDVRFTYALMAGVSFDVNSNWTIDAGYRFLHVPEGNLVDDNAALSGDIRFEDLMSHNFRVGVRYTFGDFFE